MASPDLVTVFTVPNAFKAELVKNFLEEEGIRCFLGGEEAVADLGFAPLEIDVQVAPADAERARALIAENEQRVAQDRAKDEEE